MRLIAAMLLFAIFPASSAPANRLGRLFFTPEQRTQLEYQHARNTAADGSSSVLTVNGIVQQHGGARTVWINGAAKNSAHAGEPAAEAVAVPGKSLAVKIKVGQQFLPGTTAPPSSPASAE